MIEVVEKCLIKKEMLSTWKNKIRKMIPSYGVDLVKNPKLLKKIRAQNQEILEIKLVLFLIKSFLASL
jgi:malate dehydrogenase (quinone)